MYGSYGSYSSMSATSAPMDISSRTTHTSNSSCAFPSWPRRSSLSESDHEERPTSYLSDDDLCFSCDPFDDDSRSVSSAGSSSPAISPPQAPTEAELFEMQRARLALQRQYLMNMMAEKEQRRRAAHKRQQQQLRSRSSSSGSGKKSPRSKQVSMAPIAE